MEGIIALVLSLGMPVFIVGIIQYSKYKRLLLEKSTQTDPEAKRRLEAAESENKLLEARVQNLETIVCSVDYELNAKLNRLASHQSRLALGPAPSEDPSTASTISLPAGFGAGDGLLPAGSTLLERFTVERLLGRGGMGAVYLATDSQLGEQVALKVIARNIADDPQAIERFRGEAGAARKVTHPNVIRIHDLGDDAGLLFLSMEYFPGKTLAQVLTAKKMLSFEEARPLLLQICQGLQAAHRAGVIHRDLKPQNVLVNDEGQIRLIDFGLARVMTGAGATATGMILGTPQYMAPEQIRGGIVDARADIYALGAMSYHLLCGRPPFVAETPIAVTFMHCTEPPRRPADLGVELPPKVEQALLRALEKDPPQRFETVEAYAEALRQDWPAPPESLTSVSVRE